jgi:hypothetical protein
VFVQSRWAPPQGPWGVVRAALSVIGSPTQGLPILRDSLPSDKHQGALGALHRRLAVNPRSVAQPEGGAR